MSGHRVTSSNINFYTMTKCAVKAHTEGVRRELREMNRDYKITVCVTCFPYLCYVVLFSETN